MNRLNHLKDPSYFTTGKGIETEIAKFSPDNIDINKPLICLITAVSFKGADHIFLHVNGIQKDIPTFFWIPEYTPISFSLPYLAGMKCLKSQ